ncbi:MAG: 50S ribosomal protein L30 [Acidobacteria bacterium]|nr:50S ribosomal protein L30 [Acidobacteriota bacterium]
MSATAKKNTIKIQQYKSSIGYKKNQREILRGLGIRRMNQVVERENTPAVMGMINKIPHLVRIVEEEEK